MIWIVGTLQSSKVGGFCSMTAQRTVFAWIRTRDSREIARWLFKQREGRRTTSTIRALSPEMPSRSNSKSTLPNLQLLTLTSRSDLCSKRSKKSTSKRVNSLHHAETWLVRCDARSKHLSTCLPCMTTRARKTWIYPWSIRTCSRADTRLRQKDSITALKPKHLNSDKIEGLVSKTHVWGTYLEVVQALRTQASWGNMDVAHQLPSKSLICLPYLPPCLHPHQSSKNTWGTSLCLTEISHWSRSSWGNWWPRARSMQLQT